LSKENNVKNSVLSSKAADNIIQGIMCLITAVGTPGIRILRVQFGLILIQTDTVIQFYPLQPIGGQINRVQQFIDRICLRVLLRSLNAVWISSTRLKKSRINRSSVFLPRWGADRFSRDRAWTAITPCSFLSTYIAASLGWSKPVRYLLATTSSR
jgi:hypothetical protein